MADAERSPLPPPPVEGRTGVAYAIFEGGGARGVTHVGAAKALEREQIELIGVAGASAGAIIAALLAAGFTADELFDPVAGTDLLQSRHKTPISLLGESAWAGFTGLRRRATGFNGLRLGVLMILSLLVLFTAIWWLGRWAALMLPALLLLAGAALWPWLRQLLWPLLGQLGLFDTSDMAAELNAILRDKLRDHYHTNGDIGREPPAIVTFGDLDPVEGGVRQCRRLKIVVSDVGSGSVRIFDRTTPGVAVADAVAASAAIPLFFAPPRLRGGPDGVFADGGLVSNLPVWVFARDRKRQERDLEQRIPVIAFKLLDQVSATAANTGRAARLLSHIGRVLRTGIFGSQSVISDVLPDVLIVGLPSRLSTFQFDMTRQLAVGAYNDGYWAAAHSLGRRRLEQEWLGVLLDNIRSGVLSQLPADLRKPATKVRVSLLDPDRRFVRQVDSFRVIASAGMDSDADARLEIDSRSRGAPTAWAEGRPVYVEDLLNGTAKSRHMTRAEDALIWPKLKSLIAVPIYDSQQLSAGESQIPQRILCIDASVKMRALFDQPSFRRWLDEQLVLLSFKEIEEQLNEFTEALQDR